MKTFAQYLTESRKIHEYRIKIVGDVPAGFILVKLNNKLVSSADEVAKILGELGPGDGVLIQGYRPNGRAEVFAFAL